MRLRDELKQLELKMTTLLAKQPGVAESTSKRYTMQCTSFSADRRGDEIGGGAEGRGEGKTGVEGLVTLNRKSCSLPKSR